MRTTDERRIRHDVADACTVVAFSLVTSVGLAGAFVLATRVLAS